MDLRFQSKPFFISGSTKGIGFATAKFPAQEGARVIINGRTSESVNNVLDKIEKTTESNANWCGL